MSATETARVLPVAAKPARSPLSFRTIDLMLARATGGFGFVFGLQALPVAIAQLELQREPWGLANLVLVYACLLAVAVTSAVDRGWRVASALFPVVYLVVLVAWPLTVHSPEGLGDAPPWPWYICTVATVNAAMAYRLRTAIVYTLAVPLVYGVIRVLPTGGDAGLVRAALDATYAAVLGLAALIIIASLRNAAAAVDAAQATALDEYSRATARHARDLERVQVDAIMHDSVLATLLAAAGADTPRRRALAVEMASNAIEKLHEAADATPDAANAVLSVGVMLDRLRAAAGSFSIAVTTRATDLDGLLPARVVEAVCAASEQAIANSMLHAGSDSVARRVDVEASAGRAFVRVTDDGIGFDPDRIPLGRLGLAVSVVDRMRSVGGSADIDAEPGRGATIILRWPAQEER